jgi:DNA-binding MarR family transcriptional regulator
MAKGALYSGNTEDALGTKLYLSAYRVMRHSEQVLAEFDISYHSYLALYFIDKIPRVSMKELCSYLDVTQSIVSRTIKALEEKGFVRKGTTTDKRKVELSLTTAARKKLRLASSKLYELSFLLRHQPDFRIAALEEQLDRIGKSLEVAKTRPMLRSTNTSDPGESVMVRFRKKVTG